MHALRTESTASVERRRQHTRGATRFLRTCSEPWKLRSRKLRVPGLTTAGKEPQTWPQACSAWLSGGDIRTMKTCVSHPAISERRGLAAAEQGSWVPCRPARPEALRKHVGRISPPWIRRPAPEGSRGAGCHQEKRNQSECGFFRKWRITSNLTQTTCKNV